MRKTNIELQGNTSEITNPVNGKIAFLSIDGKKFKYIDDFEKFFTNSQPQNTYTSFNDKLLFPMFDESKNIEIIYYTSDCAVDEEGSEKAILENSTDKTLIPEAFAEPILVYGTCMRLKGNPQHIRFNYWYSMYKDALANLRSKLSIDADSSPGVKLYRL